MCTLSQNGYGARKVTLGWSRGERSTSRLGAVPDGSDFSSSSEEARRMKQGKEAGQDAQWKLTGGRETEAGNEVLAARLQL